MADDVHEQVFNEKQLYTGEVVGEDEDDTRLRIPFASGAANATQVVAREPVDDAASRTANKAARRRKRASARATQIVYWLESKYDILFEVCAAFENWKEAPTLQSDIDLIWSDSAIPADRFMKLKPYQKINHFVGMSSITRKNNLGRNLLRMRKQYPTEYKFFPDTWILPTDLSDFKLQFTPAKNKTFIIKPDNGCQGKGIFMIRDGDKVPVDFSTTYVAQRYIHKPFLLDGLKFDLRLYVLVLGCDPLRIFLHKRGLVRLASEQYVEPSAKNLQNQTVHLTNYAINKLNPNFEENTNPDDAQDGHKRSWEAVLKHLREHKELDVDTMLEEIEDLIIKTLIAVQPSLSHFYHSCQPEDTENSMCFEILGFDVMLDHKLQPWLIEVNHAPSFATESELDRVVKHEVLRDSLSLLNISPDTRRRHKREAREKMEQRAMGALKKQTMEERSHEEHQIALERTAWEDQNLNGFKRLYPSEQKEREYGQIHDAAIGIWEMLMGGNSRRSVRLTTQETDDDKSDKRKGDTADPNQPPRERRSADEMLEMVARLSAGCSARPRESCKPRRRGNQKLDSNGEGSAANATNDEDGEAGPSTALSKGPSPPPDETQPRAPPPRPDVQVGDTVKVQTNLGWENVIVKAKRMNGKVDILFQDGEYMRSVLPRILRESVPRRETERNSEEQDSHAASASSSAHPKTARSNADVVANTVAAVASRFERDAPMRTPSLPAACSPIDHAHAVKMTPMPVESRESAADARRDTAAGVIAAAANVIAGNIANVESGASSSTCPSSSPLVPNIPGADAADPNDDLLNPMGSTSRSSTISQLRAKRAREANARGFGEPLIPNGGVSHQFANVGRGARPAVPAPPAPTPPAMGGINPLVPSQEEPKVHEVRLRHQLQQLISVRPIVTRTRRGTGADEIHKSWRRHSSSSNGAYRP